ncbi:MAG: hypothetical protein EXQ58_07615 [Acidobacteria bacterium]|nr:hypothetical protein [Acidobacteriota bacterium]
MKSPGSLRLRTSKLFLTRISVIILLGLTASWFTVQEISRRSLLKLLPAPPDISKHPQLLVDEITRIYGEVRANPRSVDKLTLLALTYHANGMFLEARDCYKLACLLSPDDYRWPYYLAITEEALGCEETAIELLRRVTQLHPSYVHTWARLGNLFRRASRRTEAKAAFDVALSLDPLHPHACLGLARIVAHENDWPAVIEILEPVLKVHPLFAPAVRLLSRAYAQTGHRAHFDQKFGDRVPIEEVIDEPLLNALYERSALAFIHGNTERGKALLSSRCNRCHSTDRIQVAQKSYLQWLHTLARMQRQAGLEWLNHEDSADILAYLVK